MHLNCKIIGSVVVGHLFSLKTLFLFMSVMYLVLFLHFYFCDVVDILCSIRSGLKVSIANVMNAKYGRKFKRNERQLCHNCFTTFLKRGLL